MTLPLYGKQQAVRCRSQLVKARFLNGRVVLAVWCEFKTDKGVYKKAALLLCTDTTLSPEQVITNYAKRWSIESSFHQLKEAWGMKEAWQRTRQVLHRWVQLILTGYGLVQLLHYLGGETVEALCQHAPWRAKKPLTAGRIRAGLLMNLHHVRVRGWWDRKRKIFQPLDEPNRPPTPQKVPDPG